MRVNEATRGGRGAARRTSYDGCHGAGTLTVSSSYRVLSRVVSASPRPCVGQGTIGTTVPLFS